MRPLLVVVIGVGTQHPVEVAIARDQQPVEAFGSHGPDLRDRVGSVGVSTISMPSVEKTSSKAPENLESRSWMRKRRGSVR